MDKNLRLFNLNCKTKLPHKYLVNMVLGDHLLWLLGFVGRDPSPFKTTQIKNSDKLGAKKKRKSANVFTLILNLGGKQWIWILMWEVCDRRGSVHYRTFYSSNRGKRRQCLAFSIGALKNSDSITEVKYFMPEFEKDIIQTSLKCVACCTFLTGCIIASRTTMLMSAPEYLKSWGERT